MTAKQNSKGKKQWFIGYKAHLATDDHGVPMGFAVTGASVHDSQVAVPLMKKTRETADFLYALLDKGYISPLINDYVDMIGRKAIIDRRAYRGVVADPLDPASQQRYGARTTVERTNSELKDGYLPDVIYKRGCHARYEIALAVLLTTMKKVRKVLMLYEQQHTLRVAYTLSSGRLRPLPGTRDASVCLSFRFVCNHDGNSGGKAIRLPVIPSRM